MISFSSRKQLIMLFICSTAIVVIPKLMLAQNCECEEELCCSKWGYCGTEYGYCGKGCQGGPCYYNNNNKKNRVSDIVTESFFNRIADQAASDCEGKGFYTRSAFLEALKCYPKFATVGSSDDNKREIAAFFAHVTHETGRLARGSSR